MLIGRQTSNRLARSILTQGPYLCRIQVLRKVANDGQTGTVNQNGTDQIGLTCVYEHDNLNKATAMRVPSMIHGEDTALKSGA